MGKKGKEDRRKRRNRKWRLRGGGGTEHRV
jgi:hypothetical protein